MPLGRDFAIDNKSDTSIRSITKSNCIPNSVVYENHSANLDIDKANLYNKYFYSVFSQSTYSLPPVSQMPFTSAQLNFVEISEEEVYLTLTNLDPHKAFGFDCISPAVLKHCAIALTKPLQYVFT